METTVLGLHHITAIAGDAQRNHDFYTKTLGLRLVKKTVNFDDPKTYHFYFGDQVGTPGTIMTFFPWVGVKPGRVGAGMATEIGYSVPKDSLDFWKARLETFGVQHSQIQERFGEKYIRLEDPDGLVLHLIGVGDIDRREGWYTNEILPEVAIRGFHTVTLTLNSLEATASVLTELLGYRLIGQVGNLYRYQTDSVDSAAFVDLQILPELGRGVHAGGTNHHVAFRVENDEMLMGLRQKIVEWGLHITEKIDRNYFYSLYFREPGGVLFEIATDNPGFVTDESQEELGQNLMLPAQYESVRDRIEKVLPKIS